MTGRSLARLATLRRKQLAESVVCSDANRACGPNPLVAALVLSTALAGCADAPDRKPAGAVDLRRDPEMLLRRMASLVGERRMSEPDTVERALDVRIGEGVAFGTGWTRSRVLGWLGAPGEVGDYAYMVRPVDIPWAGLRARCWRRRAFPSLCATPPASGRSTSAAFSASRTGRCRRAWRGSATLLPSSALSTCKSRRRGTGAPSSSPSTRASSAAPPVPGWSFARCRCGGRRSPVGRMRRSRARARVRPSECTRRFPSSRAGAPRCDGLDGRRCPRALGGDRLPGRGR